MISTAYIHGYAPHDQFLNESHFYVLDVDDAENALISLEAKLEEKKYFGESTDEYLLYVEAEKEGFFTSIGNAIINLFKSFFSAIKGIGESIKNCFDGSRKKLSEEKTLEAMRSNPELAQDFLKSVLNGDIKARDVKDLNKMIDEATEITKKLTKGEYDKKTFSDKMGEFGDKAEKVLKPLIVVLGLAGTAFGAVQGYNNVRNQREERRNRDEDRRNAAEDRELRNRQTELNIRRTLNDLGENPWSESSIDMYEGDYVTETASPVNAVKKLMNFFSERIDFCNNATNKMSGLQSELEGKLKTCKTVEDASIIKTAMGEIRKLMAIITQEMTTAKNVASKFFKKAGGDK